MKRKIWIAVLVCSLSLAVIAGVNIYRLNKEYQAGISEYKALEQYAVVEEIAVEKEISEAALPETVSEEAAEESVIPVNITVDFAHLREVNEDITGWLYYAPLEISYPIVRGNDNDYYTHHTFEKENNSSGAIFMDFLNKPNMDNYNTIIYGHNMRNGTMFGSLKKVINDTSIIEENPYFYIYTEEKKFMYQIVSSYITVSSSNTYNLIQDEQDQKAYLDYIKEVSEYYWGGEIQPEDKIVTLSTCHGRQSTNRTIVHGVLIAEEDR